MIDYRQAWQLQNDTVSDILKENRGNILYLCQHPTVITIGKNGTDSSLVASEVILNNIGVEVIYNDRGGDATLHNPGQLVGYPIFNLVNYQQDLHWFLREIEECLIELVAIYGITGHRIDGLTGVWVENTRKIAAIGLHCHRWITSHGFALNVNNDIKEFDYIVPCGIKNKSVTSISSEIGTEIAVNSIVSECKKIFDLHF
jgi:lipoyl(octanoyl) transferase